MVTRWDITNAVRGSDLPAPARLIMHTLLVVAEVGTAEIPPHRTPSLGQLARETGLTKSTVTKHLNALEADGWVTRIRPETTEALGRGERTKYRLGMPSAADGQPSAADEHSDQNLVRETDSSSAGDGLPSAANGHRNRSSSDEKQIENKPSTSEIDLPARPDIERLCRLLADRIEENGYKRPTVTKQWRTDCRLMLDRDNRNAVNVERAIEWATKDDFWRQNIQSMGKLRKHYDRMADQAAQQKRAAANGKAATTTLRAEQIDDAVAEVKAMQALMGAPHGR